MASSYLDPDAEDGRSFLPSTISGGGGGREDGGPGGIGAERGREGGGARRNVTGDADEDASMRPILPSQRGSSPVPSTFSFGIVGTPSLYGGGEGRGGQQLGHSQSGTISISRSTEPIRFSPSVFNGSIPSPSKGNANASSNLDGIDDQTPLHNAASHPQFSLSPSPSRPPSTLSTASSSIRYAASSSKGWARRTSGGADSVSGGGTSTKPTTVNGDMLVGHIAEVAGVNVEELDEESEGGAQAEENGEGIAGVAGGGVNSSSRLPAQGMGQENAVAGPGPSTVAGQNQQSSLGTPVISSPFLHRTITRNSATSNHHVPPSPLSANVIPTQEPLDELGDDGQLATPLSPSSSRPSAISPAPANANPPPSPFRYRLAQAPPRTDPHPRHNPRPMAVPSDNASVDTLASSAYATGGYGLWTKSIAGTLDESVRVPAGTNHWEMDQGRAEDEGTNGNDARGSGNRQSVFSLEPPVLLSDNRPTTTGTPASHARQGSIDSTNKPGDDGDNASINYPRGFGGGQSSMLGGLAASSYYFSGARRSIVGEDASIRALRRRGSWESDASRFSWVPGMGTASLGVSQKGLSEAQVAQALATRSPGPLTVKLPDVSIQADGASPRSVLTGVGERIEVVPYQVEA